MAGVLAVSFKYDIYICMRSIKFNSLIVFLCLLPAILSAANVDVRPQDIVDMKAAEPVVITDIRYFTSHNFVGEPIDGYNAPKCLLTQKAARALKDVQAELTSFGLKLRIYDCYRPQMAVDHFARWAKDVKATKMKKEFYPGVDKKDLFKDGYIALRSGHSRGSTVDLTIDGLDMGTRFDFFGPLSHPLNADIKEQARANRMLLKALMEKYGFKGLKEEWWHFTLKHEPHPDTYYDFAVE